MESKRILIVDDHPFVLNGLTNLINKIKGLNVIGQASNGKEALQFIKENTVDIIVTDIEMPEMDGNELIDVLNRKYPKIKIIVITMHSHHYMVKKILGKNINAILSKSAGEVELKNAIADIENGNMFIDPNVHEVIIGSVKSDTQTIDQGASLTQRERQILQLIYEGYNTQEISEKLCKSKNTIESHRRNMFLKCGVKNIASLIKYGFEKGLIKI